MNHLVKYVYNGDPSNRWNWHHERETPTLEDLRDLWAQNNPYYDIDGSDPFGNAGNLARWNALDDREKLDVAAIYDTYAESLSEAFELYDSGDVVPLWGAEMEHESDYEALGYYCEEELGAFNDVPGHLIFYIDRKKYGRDVVLEGNFSWSPLLRVLVEYR
ncbi:MAG: antirestriction protein ArdA [Kiritimatiellae bacterium]|nr:antirestriction protein ArdA [Kiritimatiellia bacterium]